MSLDLSAEDRKALAKDLAAELDTGQYGSRFVLSRRQLLSLAGGSAGVAGLVALGVDPATAQSAAGQVGTSSSPEDVFASDLDVQNGAEFNGSDLTGVGLLSTELLSTNNLIASAYSPDQTIPSGQSTRLELSTVTREDSDIITVDLSANEFVIQEPGDYLVFYNIRWNGSSGWSTGDLADVTIRINGSAISFGDLRKISTNREMKRASIVAEGISQSDTISCQVIQDSGQDQGINGGLAANTFVTIARL